MHLLVCIPKPLNPSVNPKMLRLGEGHQFWGGGFSCHLHTASSFPNTAAHTQQRPYSKHAVAWKFPGLTQDLHVFLHGHLHAKMFMQFAHWACKQTPRKLSWQTALLAFWTLSQMAPRRSGWNHHHKHTFLLTYHPSHSLNGGIDGSLRHMPTSLAIS